MAAANAEKTAMLRYLPLSLFALWATVAYEQTGTTGQIAGTVTDPSGAVISGATLKLDSQAGIHRETKTGDEGSYVLNLLPPGH